MTSQFPPEVLTEILSYTKNDGIDITNPNTYPTDLSLVCKSWHALILSAPEIWSHIRVDLDTTRTDTQPLSPQDINTEYCAPDSNSLSPRILSALRTCLERSGLLKPLTLDIRAREVSSTESHSRKRDLLGSILSTLLHHAHRWSDISFDFDIDLFVFMFPPNRPYPRLRRIKLLHGSTQDPLLPHNSPPPVGTFSNAHILEELHLNRFPRFISQLSLPWSRITYFSLIASVDVIFAHTLVRLVGLMPHLCALTLDHISGPPHRSIIHPLPQYILPPEHPVSLLALEKLEIRSRTPPTHHFRSFFEWISTPHMTILELGLGFSSRRYQTTTGTGTGVAQDIKDLISRSHCEITHLALRDVYEADVLILLKQVSSSVKALTLEDIQFSKTLLNRITIPRRRRRSTTTSLPPPSPNKQSCLGQQVEKMIINRPEFLDPEKGPTMFISMIRSRLPALRPTNITGPLTLHHPLDHESTTSVFDTIREEEETQDGHLPSSLTQLQITIQTLSQQLLDESGINPSEQLTTAGADLYQRLVKNFVKPEYEALDIKIEISEDVASGRGRRDGGEIIG